MRFDTRIRGSEVYSAFNSPMVFDIRSSFESVAIFEFKLNYSLRSFHIFEKCFYFFKHNHVILLASIFEGVFHLHQP